MTEQIRPSQADLTNQAQNPYPRGGEHFMAEIGEGPQVAPGADTTPEQKPGQKISILPKVKVTPERVEAARRLWEESTRGKELSGQDREFMERAIAAGIPPDRGGGEDKQTPDETIVKEGILDPRLRAYIDRINMFINSGEPPREILRMESEAVGRLEGVNEQEKEEVLARIDSAYDKAPEQRREGIYGERKLMPSEKEKIKKARKPKDIEKLFNRMFDRVDARPQSDFTESFGSAGSFEYEEFMKILNEEITRHKDEGNITGAEELNLIRQQFANEKKAREVIHNAYFGVLSGVDTEGMAKYIETFLSGWADLAFSKEGVTQAMHFYEQALLIVREKAGGYLKPKEVVGRMKRNEEGEVNTLARKYLIEANNRNLLSKGKDEAGEPIKLDPWQIDRALSFARGMSIITGRTIEIAASSILPQDLTAFTDQYAQRIIGELAPFRHSYKFFVGSKFSRILAYVMDRGRKPWDPKEIQEFDDLKRLKNIEQFDVLNGLVPDGQERFYSVLNPFEIGGILSRTGWRIAGGGVTMIDDLVREEIKKGKGKGVAESDAWIGTGVQIERKRGNFVKKEKSDDPFKATEDAKKAKEAEEHIRSQLDKMGQRTPLRLFLNIRSVQDKVLEQIAKESNTTLEKFREIMAKPREEWETDEEERIGGLVVELQDQMEELVLLQEQANLNKKEKIDDFLGKASEDTRKFVRKIREVWGEGEKEKFLKTLREKEWKLPYTFGTDDVPYDEYDFEVPGLKSVARRWGDMASAAKASKAFSELLTGIEHFKEQGQIVEAMRKVYEGVKGYNEDDARKFTLKLAEGIIKFYGKNWQHRLPFGIGSLIGLTTGKSSYAQIAYGRGAMAWDEVQVNEFTRLLRDNGMLTIEQQHELQKRAGGGKKEVIYGLARTIIPLIGLAIIWYLLSKVKDEK